MSNSNSNDKKYSGLFNYIFSENLTSFIVTIIISVLIFLGFIFGSDNNKIVFGGFVLFLLINGIYVAYEYSDYSNYNEAQNKKRKQKKKQIKDEADAKDEALLEENAICNVNPNLCMNGGKCKSVGSDLQQFQCNCTAGWKGNNCNTADGITINESDIDNRCSDPTTGQKKPDLEWCNANFDNKGGTAFPICE